MPDVPKGAKTPEDRKPKTAPKSDVKTATAGGREWEVPAGALDDFELLDDLGQIEQGNPARLPSVLRRLIGDQWSEAMDSIRDKDTGRVGVEAGAVFVREIMESLDPNS